MQKNLPQAKLLPSNKNKSNEWWRGGIFYQIYPRSFMDSTGNGIGDLPGITEKLDYVSKLGVDAIWISPFFKSPMKDFGYDIADHCDVDPLFGTIDDFKTLLDKAHDLNIKVIIDMVMSHTSIEHPWFTESRKDKTNPKSDWYVWADPKEDGTAPNNWLSLFGGTAWQFDIRRGQYYLHNFLTEQPDLNFHNPDVQSALLDACRFWFKVGVDGLRLDVINFCFHDKELRDNPARTDGVAAANQLDFIDPYAMQFHKYDKTQPENFEFLRKLRALSDEYPETMLLGEIGDDDAVKMSAAYSSGDDLLHTTYIFALMQGQKMELTASYIRNALEEQLKQKGNSWPSWAFSNHDVVRSASRFCNSNNGANPEQIKTIIALLFSLRGTAFLYEGEELGLPEAQIPFEKLQDPWGKYLWPEWQGRDGCRTPMPWQSDEKNDDNKKWLPIPEEHYDLSVDLQEKDKDSSLNFTRDFLKWRKDQPALITGDIEFHDFNDERILGFIRTEKNQSMICIFNLSGEEKTVETPMLKEEKITLPPFGRFHSSSS